VWHRGSAALPRARQGRVRLLGEALAQLGGFLALGLALRERVDDVKSYGAFCCQCPTPRKASAIRCVTATIRKPGGKPWAGAAPWSDWYDDPNYT